MSLEAMSVLVPSRGRPGNMERLVEAFQETCHDSTYLNCIVDLDDPEIEAYHDLYNRCEYQFFALWIVPKTKHSRPGIVHPLNYVANEIFNPKTGMYPTILGFMGDDHLPRTDGWDIEIERHLSATRAGVVYGNDLLQGENLPTAAFLTSNIVQTLGWMAPPDLNHLYVDNFWLDLGRGIGRIRYLDDVIIEHLHPMNGKSEWDQTYEECNNPNAARDKFAYLDYKAKRFPADLAKVQGLL